METEAENKCKQSKDRSRPLRAASVRLKSFWTEKQPFYMENIVCLVLNYGNSKI